MSEWCREKGVEVWGYCLMPNHVHLIAVPTTEVGLRLDNSASAFGNLPELMLTLLAVFY